jgi:RNA polymerase sigma-70 factor (ECF subfamily)
MDRETELGLVNRLRAGDPAAFGVVYDLFHPRLFNFLARLSRRRAVAEDLVEEAWLRLVAHAPRLRPDTRLGPWLFTVARHLHSSYCRSRLLEEGHSSGLTGLWPFGSPKPSPFEVAVASEAERRIEAALAALPLSYREAILLVSVEGLQPAEAAAVCGVTPEAMRQRLSRARAALARHLEDMERPGLTALNEVTT